MVKISLTEGNAELPSESLVVSGYDVSGVVTSKGEPVEDVTVLLYGKKDVRAQHFIWSLKCFYPSPFYVYYNR